jgi:hypothetical protein
MDVNFIFTWLHNLLVSGILRARLAVLSNMRHEAFVVKFKMQWYPDICETKDNNALWVKSIICSCFIIFGRNK